MSEKITVYKNEDTHIEVDISDEYDIIYFNKKLIMRHDYDYDYNSETARKIMHKIFKLANDYKNVKDENEELKQLLVESIDNERETYYSCFRLKNQIREEIKDLTREIDELKKRK